MVSRIPDHPKRTNLEPLIDRANDRLRELLCHSRKNLLAYSGGKDSIVVAHLATKHGINEAVSELSFCFPRDVAEFGDHAKHLGLAVFWQNSLNMDWLKKHPHLLFADLKQQSELYAKRQQATIKRIARRLGYTGIITGRRKQENTVRSHLYQTADGKWNCHPLIDWTTDNIWQYIHDHRLPYPTIYKTPIGKLEGADPFIGVSATNAQRAGFNHYDLIHEYDPHILWQLHWHEPTRNYLKTKLNA